MGFRVILVKRTAADLRQSNRQCKVSLHWDKHEQTEYVDSFTGSSHISHFKSRQLRLKITKPEFKGKGTKVWAKNTPACSLEVKSCRLHIKFRRWPQTRLLQLLTKTADYWTKIKHLPTNLWTGCQTTESTAILRILFSCLLLWFDWAGELRLVPPNPQSLDPISHSIGLRWCGWQSQDASIYLLYLLHSSGCSLGAFSLSTLFLWRLNSQQMFSTFVPLSFDPRNQEHSLKMRTQKLKPYR